MNNPDKACPSRDGAPGDPHIYEGGHCVFCGDHEIFGPVIFQYTDKEAIEDGVFIALNYRDRVTSNAFYTIVRAAEDQGDPPSCWPVDLMGYIGAKDAYAKALAMVNGLVLREWNRVVKDGGPIAFYAVRGSAGFRRLVEHEPKDTATYLTLWLEANEMSGVTLLLPEDH